MTQKYVTPSLADIADRMKQIREAWRETQRGMGRLLKCSLTAWQSYENGKSYPGGKTLISLWERGVNITWLLTGEGEMQPSVEEDKRMIERHKNMSQGGAPQWPFPWPHHPLLLQTVVEGLEETIIKHGLQRDFSIRRKAKTIVSLYEALIPDYADGTKPIIEDDGNFEERFAGTIKLIANG